MNLSSLVFCLSQVSEPAFLCNCDIVATLILWKIINHYIYTFVVIWGPNNTFDFDWSKWDNGGIFSIFRIPPIFDAICVSSGLTNCASFMDSLVTIKLLFLCLLKFSNSFFVVNLIAISIGKLYKPHETLGVCKWISRKMSTLS